MKPCVVIVGSTNFSSPVTALHSVLVPPKTSSKGAHVSFDTSCSRYSSSVAKRISSTGSLSHPHSTLIITSIGNFSEEMSQSIDCENTYLYPEETSRIDDIFSLTSITPNIVREIQLHPADSFFPSDTDDTSEAITSAVQPYGDLSVVLQ